MKHAYQKEIFSLFEDRTIAYNPGLAKALESVNASIFIGQLLYWHGKGHDSEWIYKTVEEFRSETGLSRKQQDTVIKICKRRGFLETKLAQVPPKRHFKLNFEKLHEWLAKLPETDKLNSRNVAKQSVRSRRNITENHPRDHPRDEDLQSSLMPF